jgi:EAL domain-containing protein (putative c-di-GMP-specific phosphodiesterase class I)
MTEKRGSRKIVAAVVGLGHSLDMMTVAEGVETEEQASILLWLALRAAQLQAIYDGVPVGLCFLDKNLR